MQLIDENVDLDSYIRERKLSAYQSTAFVCKTCKCTCEEA